MPLISRTLSPDDTVGLARAITILERVSDGRADFPIEIERLSYASNLDPVIEEQFRLARGDLVAVSEFAVEPGIITCRLSNEGDLFSQELPTEDNPPVSLSVANSISAGVSFDSTEKRVRFVNVVGFQIQTEIAGGVLLANVVQIDIDLSSNKIDVTFTF
jgi:hypothetical protein